MELFKRILIAVIFIPLVLLILHRGGIALASLLAMVVFIQGYEMRELFLKKDVHLPRIIIILNLIAYLLIIYFQLYGFIMAFVLILTVIMGNDLFRNRIRGVTDRISYSLILAVYTAVFISTVYFIRQLEQGEFLVVFLMILIWLTDTFAYFTGITLGRHDNLFKASPRKTMEGFCGGFAAASIGAWILTSISPVDPVFIIPFALSAGVFGQLGDLFESLIKREVGVKDSSRILPGHGGILDRFDSLSLAAPVFYIIVMIIKLITGDFL